MTARADALAAAADALRLAADALERAASSETSADAADRLLSVEEAADALGIGRSALYAEISAGRCRSLRVGRRRLVPSSVVADYMREAGTSVRTAPAPREVRNARAVPTA